MSALPFSRRRRFREAVGVFLLCLVVYHLNGRPHAEVDCVAAPFVAWSLVRHGSLDLSPYPDLIPRRGTAVVLARNGQWVSERPVGSALVAVPFVLPWAVVSANPPSPLTMLQIGKLSGAVCVAISAVLFFCLCRRLAPQAAWPATILYAFGTCLWSVASQALWMHGSATLFVCAGLVILLPEEPNSLGWRRTLLAGLCLGLAVLCRPTTAFFPLATGVLWLGQRRWRQLIGFGLGGLGPVAVLLAMNVILHGDAIRGGYHDDDWTTRPPLWLGLGGLLVAPSRGLFVYSPALLLAPLGLIARRAASGPKLLLAAWTAAAGVTILFFARWHDWRGGWCFGPRFTCETMPIFCLLFALGYQQLRGPWRRRAAELLIALSVAVHVVGVFGYRGYVAWQDRHQRDDDGRCLFTLQDTQIEAHARSVWGQIVRHDH